MTTLWTCEVETKDARRHMNVGVQGSELARKGPSDPLRVPSESRVLASLARNSGTCGLGPLGAQTRDVRDFTSPTRRKIHVDAL